MVSDASNPFTMKVASSDVEKYNTVFIHFSKIILKLTPVYAIIKTGKGNEIFTHTKTKPHEIAARGVSCLIIYNGKTKPSRLITVFPYRQAICICSTLLHLPKRKGQRKRNVPLRIPPSCCQYRKR